MGTGGDLNHHSSSLKVISTNLCLFWVKNPWKLLRLGVGNERKRNESRLFSTVDEVQELEILTIFGDL